MAIYRVNNVILRGDRGPGPPCPTDADPVLVRNGTYTRPVQDGRGVYVLTIQRYRCCTCAITYSALPYDCRSYTANTWALMLAVGPLPSVAGGSPHRRAPADPRTVGGPTGAKGPIGPPGLQP